MSYVKGVGMKLLIWKATATDRQDFEDTWELKTPVHSGEGSHIPIQDMFEDYVPFPKVGYVSSLEGSWSLVMYLRKL